MTEDSDGPVEACTPIRGELAKQLGVPTRLEPAHREAFTTVTKAQLVFPQIMSAYDAVEAWTRGNGEAVAGSPREVYFTDFAAAGPDDAVADIAFPIG